MLNKRLYLIGLPCEIDSALCRQILHIVLCFIPLGFGSLSYSCCPFGIQQFNLINYAPCLLHEGYFYVFELVSVAVQLFEVDSLDLLVSELVLITAVPLPYRIRR